MGYTTQNFIYGAGRFGKLLLQCLTEWGKRIDYFVETQEPAIAKIDEIPVISFERMIKMHGRKIIFIAIQNDKTAREIQKKIYTVDVSNCTAYLCGSFINENLRIKKGMHLEGKRHCLICENNLNEFLPAGIQEGIFNRLHIIGGGYRKNCLCPYCKAVDRGRWLYYVLKNKTDISEMSGRILHFAPESGISEYIKQNTKIDYYTGDIAPGRTMHVTDITDIQYRDNTFDYVISNHILEHILDEKKAASEIKRVLKPNGRWIFSFPICTDKKTYEDTEVVTEEDRLREYGQKDHVRLYGNDYVERFEDYGWNISVFSPQKELTSVEIDRFGFIEDDVIMIATKK